MRSKLPKRPDSPSSDMTVGETPSNSDHEPEMVGRNPLDPRYNDDDDDYDDFIDEEVVQDESKSHADPSLTFKEKVQRQRRQLAVSFREDTVFPRRRRSNTTDGESEATDHARRQLAVSFQEDEITPFGSASVSASASATDNANGDGANGKGKRRRRGKRQRDTSRNRQSLFTNMSSSFFSGVMESLREEVVVRLDLDGMTSSNTDNASINSDESHFAPWLDETVITYSTRTRSGSWRKKCGTIVNHPCTQRMVLVGITANAILMGIMTFDFVSDNPQALNYLVCVDWVFLGLFVIEVILQLIWHGRGTLSNPWLCFDVGILACSWIPSLRIFRFARVINRLDILKDLTRAIGLVMPRMFSIMLFLFIVIYTYAVLFTELFRNVVFEETQYFENLFAAMFTCFEMLTMEWANIARELMNDQQYAWAPICSFVVVCGMIFFNLVLAVICDAVAALGVDWSGRNEREIQTLKDLKKKIRDTEKRVHRLHELVRQLIRNQNQSLHLLEVQLAQQLNCVETWSKLMAEVQDESMSMSQRHKKRRSLLASSLDYDFHDQTLFNKARIVAGRIIEADFFDMFIFIIICADCTMMGVATFEFISHSDHLSGVFETVSFVFLLIYTAEAALGFLHYGWAYLTDAWHAFDVFIVVTSWVFDLLEGVKTFREFRAVRIVRAFRLITALHTLRDLVTAIVTAMPRVAKIMPLLLLLFYIFAVLFVELFRDVEFDDGHHYFDRLDYALFTCLQMMTLEWAELSREATNKSNQQWARGLIVLFVVISGMLFFDLIKATVCDSVALINGRSRRLAEISQCRRKLKRLGKATDSISHKMVHTINFQQHINRMMLYDIKTLKSEERNVKRQSKDKT